jgi:hypothetical protein
MRAGKKEAEQRGDPVYQQIMYDVHRMWLQEFDHEAARRAGWPRRRRRESPRRWRLGLAFHRTRPAAAKPAPGARLVETPQCS